VPSDASLEYAAYVRRAGGGVEFDEFDDDDGDAAGVGEEDLLQFWEFARIRGDPLTVTEGDLGQKRYKAYGQWLRGKSLFKQSKVDPEYKAGT
ncbi:phosphatidylinositol-3,5-bisphosphate 5-phosphatase, partial [Teratosphaeriaceae sp. CCFEE 6253]